MNDVLVDARTAEGDVVIPDGVKYIGGYAFSENAAVTSVTIPEGVKEIENCAFYACTGIESIYLPDSVTKIGYGAFDGAEALAEIRIPETVTDFDANRGWTCPFNGTKWYSDRKAEDPLIIVNGILIDGRTEGDVYVPDSVHTIGKNAFTFSNVENVVLPESVTKGNTAQLQIDEKYGIIGIWKHN